MGMWNNSIYGNDTAMDMFCVLKKTYKNNKDFKKVIEKCKKHDLYRYDESKLVIADLEQFFNK